MKKNNNQITLSLGLALTLIFCLSDFTEKSLVDKNETQESQVYEYQSNDDRLITFNKYINDLYI